MARRLENLRVYLNGDPERDPRPTEGYIVYDVVEGNASKDFQHHKIENFEEKYRKVFHETGEVGEFWRDEVDLIKELENIP